MVRRSVSIVAVLALTTLLGITIYGSKVDIATPANLTVHEWGTFTSVAGRDGKAVQRLPLAGPNDLPCFVEYFQNRLYKSFGPIVAEVQKAPVDYAKARSQLLGPIRMETPSFTFTGRSPRKLTCVWHSRRASSRSGIQRLLSIKRRSAREFLPMSANTGATITWKNVEVLPPNTGASFPKAPPRVITTRLARRMQIRFVWAGRTKSFFYRGVGGFPVPINVTVTDAGKIHIKHLAGKPGAILFDKPRWKARLYGRRYLEERGNSGYAGHHGDIRCLER